MEENPPLSPLSAFPNEHPTPPPSKRFYTSKIFLLVTICIVLGSFGVGATVLLPMTQKKEPLPTPSPMKFMAPTPKSALNTDNSYTSTKYSYAIEQVASEPTKQTDTGHNYAEFFNGCFKLYAIPKGTENNMPLEKNDIPWNQLEDLKRLAVGNSKNCSTLSFTFGDDGAAKVNKNEYTRLRNQTINTTDWYAFAVSTGIDAGLTAHNVYFTENKTYFYLIETKEGGSCPAKTPTDMFSHVVLLK